jgi:hypothetical protein
MRIDTIEPLADLAIVGMSFRGGADCAATTPDMTKVRRITPTAMRLTIPSPFARRFFRETPEP